MDSSLPAIVCSFICCLIARNVSGGSYERISELSRQIYDEQETISPAAVISKLMEIRSLRAQIDNAVDMNARNRQDILIGLCLHRLIMDIGLDRCSQSRGNYRRGHYTDNWNANNFIEVASILKNHFKSDNMHKIIDWYFNIQLDVCRHNILTNFSSKHDSFMKKH